MGKRGPLRRNDPDRRMDDVVQSCGVGDDILELIPLSQLDPERFPAWVEELTKAEASIRHLRRALAGSSRTCAVCDVSVTGRADQVYCSPACRQRARRAR